MKSPKKTATRKKERVQPIGYQPRPEGSSRLNWMLFEPFANLRKDGFAKSNAESNLRLGFSFCALLIFFFLTAASFDAGVNGDERFHVRQAESSLKFYTSMGKYRNFMVSKDDGGDMVGKTTYMYGALTDVTSAGINKLLGNDQKSLAYQDVRHLIISLFGFIGILTAGFAAAQIAGWRAGILAMVFLFLCPRYFGHATFNPKDLPFAAFYMSSLFFIGRFLIDFPNFRRSTLIGLIASIALCLNVRVGALLLFAYLGLFTAIAYIVKTRSIKIHTEILKKAAFALMLVIPLGYFLGLIFWPYGLLNPLKNPFAALTNFSVFHTGMSILFEGEQINARNIPWYYSSKWILISTPLVILLGVIPGLFYVLKAIKSGGERLLLVSLLLFALIFPLAYVVYKGSILYDGLRHMLFVVAPFVILCALGWNLLFERFNSMVAKTVLAIILVFGLSLPAYHIAANTTYAYVYFNELVGGNEGVAGEYESDYFMLGTKEACKWLASQEEVKSSPDSLSIVSDVVFPAKVYMYNYADNTKVRYSHYYSRDREKWDYGIFFSRFVDHAQIKNGAWPPANTIYTVEAGGLPIIAVVKRQSDADLKGHRAMRQKKYDEALQHFEAALKLDPAYETVLMAAGQAAIASGKAQKGLNYFQRALQVNPNNAQIYYTLFEIYKQLGDNQKASLYGNKYNELIQR